MQAVSAFQLFERLYPEAKAKVTYLADWVSRNTGQPGDHPQLQALTKACDQRDIATALQCTQSLLLLAASLQHGYSERVYRDTADILANHPSPRGRAYCAKARKLAPQLEQATIAFAKAPYAEAITHLKEN